MADAAGDSAGSNLNLTTEEKRVFGQLFRQADTDGVGVVTGEIAVKFFDKTRLDSKVLGEATDSENRGFLTPAGFSAVLRLIGHAQAGREPTTELASQPGPLPHFDGFQLPGLSSPPPPPPATLQAQSTGGPVRIPALTPEKVNQYAGLFERQALQPGGLLPGDQAKSIFEKAGLPIEVLGRIWQLADTEQRGALVQTEFVIAMHLLTSMKSGALRGLPSILPAPLYEAATRRLAAPRQSPTATGHISAIPRQLSGSAPIRTGSPLGRPPITAQSSTVSGPDWLVTPADKARFDQLYDDLDKTRKGYITGEEAVPFLSQSSLPEDALAQIWDLADCNSEGVLNRDTFAVAMYLIRQQRTRRDGSSALPSTLPPNLVPPSMRQRTRPAAATGSPFDAPAPPPQAQPPVAAPKSALEDLFGLDTTPTPAVQAQVAQNTGGSNAVDPFAAGANIQTPSSPVKPSSPANTQFKPFVPSSSFGRGLTVHGTGDSAGSGIGSNRAVGAASDDLLGDNDPEISKKLTSETAELANLSNQVGSLSKQMQEVQGQRNASQNEFNQASAQKKNFEQRLAQLRTLYEKEAGDVQALQQQLSDARKETQKLQAECMQLDTTYRDLQTQHQQVLSSLEADRHENTGLKEKIRAVNAEVAQLKPQIEKLKSEARQQKGLVAINKKQLSTNEAERERLQSEAADLAKSHSEALSRQDTGSSLPGSASVASPAASVASANNPFFKRTGSTDIMGAFASPAIKSSAADQSFDDIFGPSQPPTRSTDTPPPPITSFKPQTTGTSTGSVSSWATPPAASPTMSRQQTLTAEPPAPPESRQISSSFLPFSDASESLSSSRAVSPPASRAGEPFESVVATPTQAPPGAFPDEPTPTGEGSETLRETGSASESKASANDSPSAAIGAVGATTGGGGGDPFAATDEEKAKSDFDNAFASFTKAHKAPEKSSNEPIKPAVAFDSEFPPISELERDDDSDTASEGGGFDDDFAPASPPKKQNEAPAIAPFGDGSAATQVPVPNATVANSSLTAVKNNSEPTAPTSSLQHEPTSPATPQNDNPFAPPATSGANVLSQPFDQAPQAKGVFDDLDDDFDGLEDAKEGSADDDFQTISRSGLDDFNPVFDSSPPQSQAKSEPATAPFGQESSYDFGSASTTSATPAGAGAGTAGPDKSSADAHDWDSIFATLDSPNGSAAGTAARTAAPLNAPAPVDIPVPAPAVAPVAEPESRPLPARGLTEDGKDDDPILRNLTNMGYSRSDALLALEKYDYNLERAANHLASQS
ncbi:hypothetical protein ACHAO3_002093 [Verticillium nonalfalfae]